MTVSELKAREGELPYITIRLLAMVESITPIISYILYVYMPNPPSDTVIDPKQAAKTLKLFTDNKADSWNLWQQLEYTMQLREFLYFMDNISKACKGY